MKLVVWNDCQAKKELATRLELAKKAKEPWENLWQHCERVCYATSATAFGSLPTAFASNSGGNLSLNSSADADDLDDVDDDGPNVNINLIQRDVRYVHSQLSSNPPAVAPTPLSSDSEDRRKADAADRMCRYAMRQYDMPNVQDCVNLQTIVNGSGAGISWFNPHKGEVMSFDEMTGEIEMEGDYEFSNVSVWDLYPDPYATDWKNIRYLFRKFTLTLEEAISTFPEHEKKLKEIAESQESLEDSSLMDIGRQAAQQQEATPNQIICYQYWETGLPVNGYQGRYVWCLEDGYLLSEVEKNPHAFRFSTGRSEESVIEKARIPIHLFTDIDVPGSLWGMSMIMFSAEAQEIMNQFINASIDTQRALGTPTLILPEGAEVADDSITVGPWNYIKVTGNSGPWTMEGARQPSGFSELIDRMKAAVQEQDGINDANLGMQQREQATALMQLASDQSNQLRRRLFNKYTKFVENVYRDYLDVARKHWTTQRKVYILGKEKAFEVMDFDATLISGGFDVVASYGNHFSLDPIMRKDQIFQLAPFLEKAGVPPRTILNMAQLSDLPGLYDFIELNADRQREIFEEMEARLDQGLTPDQAYIAPETDEAHQEMLEYCKYFRSTAEFKHLKKPVRELIRRHYKERMDMVGQAAQALAGQQPQPAPAAPAPEENNLGSILGMGQ